MFPQNSDTAPSTCYAPSKQVQNASWFSTQHSPVTKLTEPYNSVRPANADGATGTSHHALIVHTPAPIFEFFDPEAHTITQSILKISPHGSLASRASRDTHILHDIWKRDKSLMIPNALNNISLAATALSLLLHVSPPYDLASQ